MNDFRETLYTVDSHGRRKWVYPAEVFGFFRNARKGVVAILLLIYTLLPWIPINGVQAVFLDIAHRRFVFFGSTFWATDTKFLLFLLLILVISLFFFTSVLGRVWCGWACPETIFLEFVFRPIEVFFEGNAAARKRLDEAPLSLKKVRIKISKYLSFAVVAWFLASTLLAYFIGREELIHMMGDYPWHNWPTFMLTLFVMATLLFQFGWFREQFCTVLCPYARFQSVLLDDSSLLVGYDYNRGEPRGKKSKETTGDCIDCSLCVRVCPTGIDIRNGLQLECVQCAACADACDSVMVKIGKPKGLIRYDTERGLKGEDVRFLRPRVIIYGIILTSLLSFFAYSLKTRSFTEVSVFHTRGDALFTIGEGGMVTNHVELHIENKNDALRSYSVSVDDPERVHLLLPINPFPVAANAISKAPLFITFPPSILTHGKEPIILTVTSDDGFQKKLRLELLGPG